MKLSNNKKVMSKKARAKQIAVRVIACIIALLFVLTAFLYVIAI